jgi:hypothetical protein
VTLRFYPFLLLLTRLEGLLYWYIRPTVRNTGHHRDMNRLKNLGPYFPYQCELEEKEESYSIMAANEIVYGAHALILEHLQQ